MSAEFSPAVRDIIADRSGGLCEVCGVDAGVQFHHRRPRGMGGTKRVSSASASNGLHVCGACHRLIESYRTVAKMLGWLVPTAADPTSRSVLYRGRWARLGDDGGVEYERSAA